MKRTTAFEPPAALRRTGKKAVSIFASLALAVSMMGAPAYADTGEDEAAADDAPQEEAIAAPDVSADPQEEVDRNPGWTKVTDEADGSAEDEGAAIKDDAPGGTVLPSDTDAANTGAAQSIIYIDVTDARPFQAASAPTFSVALSNRGHNTINTQSVNGGYRGSYTYEAVEPGDYTVTVEADGFATYVQQVSVTEGAARAYTVKIDAWGQTEAAGAPQAGVIYYGDVTGDHDINKEDVDDVVTALHESMDASAAAPCDLTGDGAITLADLQLLADGYSKEAVTSEVSPKLRVTGAVAGEGTEVASGSQIQDVSSVVGNPDESASLKLAPSNGAISEDNPVIIELDGLQDQLGGEEISCIAVKPPVHTNGSGAYEVHPHAVAAGEATVVYDDESGNEQTETLPFQNEAASSALANMARSLGLMPEKAFADGAKAQFDAAGNLVIDFGKKIAIKKVTLKVTATQASDGNLNLAEISSVEFLNGTEDIIAPPVMNIPQNVKAEAGSKQFTVSWNAEPNVTGYEVSIVDPAVQGANEQILSTKSTSLEVTSYKYGTKGKVENGHTYTVKVQSANGTWRSGWSVSITVKPEATKVPDKPENVKARGGYKTITVSWKVMGDTDSHILYWRKQGDSSWQSVSGIESGSYQLAGLEDVTTYEVYVVGVNKIGNSAPSNTVSAKTETIAPAELPNYKLVNTKDANGRYLTGISTARVISAGMVDSPLDAGTGTALGLFDDDYTSYAKKTDWDLGCAYNAGSHGVEVTFDGVKEIGFISYAASSLNIDYSGVVVHASTGGSAWQRVSNVGFTQQKCANGRTYTLIKLGGGLRADKILIGMQRYPRLIDIAEMRFHGYDSIEDDVNALYADDMHIQLAEGVDEARINELDARLNTPDADGNYYPYKSAVQLDLDFARQLLADENAGLSEVINVHTDISPAADNGKNLGISGLNSWQPLGKVAAAGDQLVLYASARNASANSKIQLYVGQQYPESSDAPTYGGTFVRGQRIVYTVPEKIQDTGKEHGGPLYVQYTGSNPNEEWCVRVMGAHSVPLLDLHGVTDHEERVKRAESYVTQLDETLGLLDKSAANEADHKAAHLAESKLVVDGAPQDTINPSVDCAYNVRNCIHNATELMTDSMLYSVPASQVAKSCTGSTLRERAESLITRMDGSEQMLKLFYQHKGLMEPGEGVAKTNEVSSQHLNIRCMVMFAGAFMYAAGNHIGVDFPESGNFTILRPISDAATQPGATKAPGDGFYFGWGSAHEIGHNINNSRYAYAEVTNNYFAQLCKMVNEGTTRFSYDTVYDRVTSGAIGRTGNVGTQLAMYWQLMLAHDANEVYTLYSDYAALKANRFFARVDGYARNPGSAPAPGGVPLVVNAGESQNIIRLASAAAERDLTDFFTSWGLVPNAETVQYISQFPKEARALQYVNDDAVKWARANASAPQVAGNDMVAVSASQQNSKVTLSLSTKDASYNASLIGYEITRVTYASGKPQKEVVGFARVDGNGAATFVDDAAYLGNRAASYEVRAVDKFLNYSVAASTQQMKLDGNGRYTPAEWSVDTNMVSVGTDEEEVAQVERDASVEGASDPQCPSEAAADAPKPVDSVLTGEGNYTGKTVPVDGAAAGTPYVLVDMKRVNEVASVRYTPGEGNAIGKYVVETSVNGISFTQVAEGTFSVDGEGSADVFFAGKNEEGSATNWICTESARYVRITAPDQAGKELAIKEFSIFGPSGDNIDFTAVEGQEDVKAIGTLAEDFSLGQNEAGEEQKIPAGSIIFTGAVKGNPAYNVVVLYDQAGTIVGGSTVVEGEEILNAEQVLLAEVPEGSLIGDTADGRWVYWIAPDADLPQKVRAELYRVNDAYTSEGQRLVADTVFVDVPAKDALPSITLKSSAQEN